MFAKLFVALVAAAGIAGAGYSLSAKPAPVRSDCCYPGSPCCYPGSPCCEAAACCAAATGCCDE